MFKILSGTILCHQKWKQMPNYWVWAQIFSKTNLSIVTILQDFSQLHVIFPHFTLIFTKETLFSMKYNVYCLREYMNTCILHTKFFDQNVTPYLHLALKSLKTVGGAFRSPWKVLEFYSYLPVWTLLVFYLESLYPPQTLFVVGYTVFTLSVCASVHPSVRNVLFFQ